MTTWSPAEPNWPPNIDCAVAMASSAVSTMTTPLPAASPLALTTMGVRCRRTQSGSNVSRVNVA